MKLFYLIYISRAARIIKQNDLDNVLQTSVAWNKDHQLTGMLLYLRSELGAPGYGRFMQVLEGTEEEVRYIFGKIQQDSRHHNLMIMNQGPIAQRNFETWSLGVQAIDMDTFQKHPGYFELNDDFLKAKRGQDFNLPLNFLRSFYQMHLGKTG